MATVADNGYPSIVEVTRAMGPDGQVAHDIAKLMAKRTPVLEDIPWLPTNKNDGHLITSHEGLPSPTWRQYNQGVVPTKGRLGTYTEICGMLETYFNCDKALADSTGDAAAYRAIEDGMKVEAYGQEIERSLWYESALTSPERFHGLANRYPATTGYTSSSYVLKPGTNSGVNCHSVWLICWSPDKMYGLYPKNSMAGLKKDDRGQQTIQSYNGGQMEAYVTHFKWDAGLGVHDYRHAVRMQWDPDDSTNFADSAKGMYLAMQNMLDIIFDDGGPLRFYMNRTSSAKLNAQLLSNEASALQYLDLNGKRLAHFMGVPIRRSDTLIAETAIS